MAEQYVSADKMFASNLDGSSFISHQYIIAGQASSAVDIRRRCGAATAAQKTTVSYD